MLELNYKSFGQGDPVIILHGLFGTLDNWQTIARQLAETYTVFLLDQRNHGKSPHAPEFDYPTMAEDLRHFMESHWIHEAHIIGHSMGGKTAMQFALEHPDMVDKLVVVDMAPRVYPGGHETIFNALFDLNLSKIESRREADEQLAKNIPDFGVRQFLLKNLTRQKNGQYAFKMNLPVIYDNYQNILNNIDANDVYPKTALFIRGEQSDYIMDAYFPAIKAYFPEATVQTVTGAGHWVHVEAPKALLEMVEGFLK